MYMNKKDTKEPNQETLRRWFDKGLPWTYRQICAVCGTVFYTQTTDQMVCDKEKCKAKLEERSSTHE